MKGLIDYASYQGIYLKEYAYQKASFSAYESMGIDYNYQDSMGQNFLHHSLCQKVRQIIYSSESYEYILSKTKDIALKDNGGRNILFHYIKSGKAGYQGSDFFEILDKYPLLDIYVVAKDGNTLLHDAILYNTPHELTDFLLDKKVSIHQIGYNNHSLLNYFALKTFNAYNSGLFARLLKELDITHKNSAGYDILSQWIEFASDSTIAPQNKTNSLHWISFACWQIMKKSFKYDHKIICSLLETLSPEHCISDIREVSDFLLSLKLETELSPKQISAKVKI